MLVSWKGASSMFVHRISLGAALLVAILLCALGGAAQERKKNPDDKDGNTVKATLASVDAEKNTVTVTIHTFNRTTQEGKDTNKTYALAKDAKVLQDAAAAKLTDLKKGFPVTVHLDGTTANRISV